MSDNPDQPGIQLGVVKLHSAPPQDDQIEQAQNAAATTEQPAAGRSPGRQPQRQSTSLTREGSRSGRRAGDLSIGGKSASGFANTSGTGSSALSEASGSSSGSAASKTRRISKRESGLQRHSVKGEANDDPLLAGYISTPSQRAISLSARAQQQKSQHGESTTTLTDELLTEPSSTPRWDELWNSRQRLSQTQQESKNAPTNVDQSGSTSGAAPTLFDLAEASTQSATIGSSGHTSGSSGIVEDAFHDITTASNTLAHTVETASFEDLHATTRNARITLWLLALFLLAASLAAIIVGSTKENYFDVHASAGYSIAALLLGGPAALIGLFIACWAAQTHRKGVLYFLGVMFYVVAVLELIVIPFTLVASRDRLRTRGADYYRNHHETPNEDDTAAFGAEFDSAMRSMGVAALLMTLGSLFTAITLGRIIRKIDLHVRSLERATNERKRLAERVMKRKEEASRAKYRPEYAPEKTLTDVMIIRQG